MRIVQFENTLKNWLSKIFSHLFQRTLKKEIFKRIEKKT